MKEETRDQQAFIEGLIEIAKEEEEPELEETEEPEEMGEPEPEPVEPESELVSLMRRLCERVMTCDDSHLAESLKALAEVLTQLRLMEIQWGKGRCEVSQGVQVGRATTGRDGDG